jgi:ATP-dependent Clp protease ATP-binding subunit ClpA
MTQDYRIDVPLIAEAESEARVLGHDYVGNEHLLIAIAKNASDGASQLLAKHGLSASALRSATTRILGEPNASPNRPTSLRLSHRTQIAIGDALSQSHGRETSSASTSNAGAYQSMDLLRAVLNAERTSKSVVSTLLETAGLTSADLLCDLPSASA